MRWSALLLALFLSFSVPVGSQSTTAPGEPIRVLDDNTGDYYAALRDGPGITDPIPYYTFMDMDWLDVTELEEGFLFTIAVVDIEGPLDTVGFSDGGFFWIHFRHHDWDYRLELHRPSGQPEIDYNAILRSKFVDAEEWGFLWRDDEGVTWDLSTATISYFVDREDLADSRGAAPYPGRSLTDFWVLASQESSRANADFSEQTVQFPWQLQDRMPDTGIGDVAVNVQVGLAQSGHGRLYSDEPYRASNGEATTFLYTVTAHNTGPARDLFSLEAVGVPSSWNVELPLTGVNLGPDEEIPVPVLLRTPFAHQHGGTQSFTLEMRSTSNPVGAGKLELGVRYLEIPQPAGHHDTVYLHSIAYPQTASFNSAFTVAFRPSAAAYFNTYDEDPSSDDVPVTAFSDPGSGNFHWLIPLEPTLRMGLDFDLDGEGETGFEISSPGPIPEASVEGRFALVQAGNTADDILAAPGLATFSAEGRSWNPETSQTFQLPITPQEAGDYVAYSAKNELWLVIELKGTGVSTYNQNTVPAIEPGGWFQLPLNEYEDDISDAFNALTGASMSALTPATRTVNPGGVVLFDVQVTARDAAAGNYKLDVTGDPDGWSSIVTANPVAVSSTPSVAKVLVQIPEDAEDGDRADLFLQAAHSTDTQRRGLIRLVVNVDTDEEWGDDRDAAALYLGEDGKDSPMPVIPAVLALVAVALVLRRRLPAP